jgi:hypothetical protein
MDASDDTNMGSSAYANVNANKDSNHHSLMDVDANWIFYSFLIFYI